MSPAFSHTGRNLVILAACVLARGCSPVYSIGVKATLTQPMSPDCILAAAQSADGVRQVLIHQTEPREEGRLVQAIDNIVDPPTAYLVTTNDQDAQIEQRVLKDGEVTFWVGKQGVGIKPSLHSIERYQAWHFRLASHIAELCKAHYSGNTGMTCVPDSEICRQLSREPQ